MKKRLNIHHTILGLLALSVLVFSCTSEIDYSKTRTVPEKKETIIIQGSGTSNTKIFEEYDKLVKEYEEGLYFENWDYDPATNNITCKKKENPTAYMAWINHKLGLAFENHIAKENPKTLKYQALSDFAIMTEAGPYAKPLKVNGKPFSGVLIGTHKGSGQRILEVQFYDGLRIGTYNVWTDLERLYTKSFKQKIEVMDVDLVRKPVIYLYPETTQDINVKVNFKGEFTHTYPKYSEEKGWNMKAAPNGMLTNLENGKTYPYLFWEGKSEFRYNLNKGFVVEGKDIASFLDEKLETLGLNRTEATDFITYWLPELERNPYNLIHFSTEEYTQNAPLEITPAPETVIRVFMVYKPLDEAIEIPTQTLSPATRKGFTVVEWGGKKAAEFLN